MRGFRRFDAWCVVILTVLFATIYTMHQYTPYGPSEAAVTIITFAIALGWVAAVET